MNLPEMKEVDSSKISKVGYVEKTQQLYVEFKSTGAVYVYYDVPADEYKTLMEATSIGKAHSQMILRGHVNGKGYRSERISA